MEVSKEYSDLEAIERDAWFEICNKVISDAFYEGKNVTDTIKELSYKFKLNTK